MNPLSEFQHPPGAFAFHDTGPENVPAILEEGIKRPDTARGCVSTIESALTELGYESPFPFDRTNAVYCHVDSTSAAVSLSSHSETDFDCRATIVVTVEEIPASMYLASMSIISDLIDYMCGGERIMIHSDTPEEAVEQYRESITRVESPADIADYTTFEDDWTELVVTGDIPPSAIVEVVR